MVEEYRTAGRYALAFAEDAITVELDAWDRASAFATAQRLVKQGRSATLLEDARSPSSTSRGGRWRRTRSAGSRTPA